MVAGKCRTSIVGTSDYNCFKELPSGVALSRFEMEFCGSCKRFRPCDSDRLVEVSPASDKEGREELLCARNRTARVRIFLEKNLAGACIDENG